MSETETAFADALRGLDASIERLQHKKAFLLRHQETIELLGLSPCCASRDYIDFDCLKREQVVEIFKRIGGTWNKEVAFAREDKINYLQPLDNGITLRLYHAEPPDSCKLIEEDVVIPAQPERVEKRTRLVCKEESV